MKIGDRDVRARLRQRECDRAPDAPGGSGDEGDLAFE